MNICNYVVQLKKEFLYRRAKKKFESNAEPITIDLDWTTINYNRIAIVNYFVSKMPKCQKYLEIGCAHNILFDSVFCNHKVGVDPEQGGTHRMTSDLFFENNKEKFHVIFLDGLHTYQQLNRDLKNALQVLEDDGVILMHDMLPLNWEHAHVPKFTDAWNGDVWKTSFDILENESISYNVVKADCGVGIVKKTKEYCDEFQGGAYGSADFSYYVENFKKLPLIDFQDLVSIYD